MADQPFDDVGDRFEAHYNQVRGYVRRWLTRRNLEPYLGQASMNIADIGGGRGNDSEWLADQGHRVLLVEPSPQELAKSSKIGKKIGRLHGDVDTLLSRGIEHTFDLVLSHGVIMYDLKSPEQHIVKLGRLLKQGGLLSLLTKGYGGAVDRFTRQNRTEDLRHLEKTHQIAKNNMEQRVWAFEPKEIAQMLDDAGFRVLEWAGVRIETDDDNRQISDLEDSELVAILDSESALGHDPERRAHGQMLHFIAQI